MDEQQEDVYIDLYKYLHFNGIPGKSTDWDHCRVLEILTFEDFRGIDRKDLIMDLPSLFSKLWLKDKEHHVGLIYLEDEINQGFDIFRDKRWMSQQPYEKITDAEALTHVSLWIQELFEQHPPGIISNVDFARNVLQNLRVKINLCRLDSLDAQTPGLALRSGWVGNAKGDELLWFMPYTTEYFVKQCYINDPLPCMLNERIREQYAKLRFPFEEEDPISPQMKDHLRMEEEKIQQQFNQGIDDPLKLIQEEILDEDFQNFLRVITEDSQINAVCFRSMIQRVIFALREGLFYQQGFWIVGPPSSGKTTMMNILRLMAQGSSVELPRNKNQFTALSFQGAKLITVSDISKLSTDMIEMLRVLLGRDTMYAELKFKDTREYIKCPG